MDYAGPIEGHMLLVIADAHSKWLEAHVTTSSTAKVTIENLRVTFVQLGISQTVVTDNGPCFSSEEFKEFLKKNGIRHITSSLYHSVSNGLAEQAVQSLKQAIKKQRTGRDKVSLILMAYRSTPQTTTGCSPAELMFGRLMNTRFDLLKPNVENRVCINQEKQKQWYDQRAQDKVFEVSDLVYAK